MCARVYGVCDVSRRAETRVQRGRPSITPSRDRICLYPLCGMCAPWFALASCIKPYCTRSDLRSQNTERARLTLIHGLISRKKHPAQRASYSLHSVSLPPL